MTQVVPTRAAILQRIKTDYRVEVGADPLRRSVEYALCRALMGQSAGLYGLLQYYLKQLFPDTAEDQYLWRWVRIFLGDDGQKPATYWTGQIAMGGTPGTVVPKDTVLVRSDGQQYVTTAAGVVSTLIPASSVEPGLASNLDIGQQLSLGNPIVGVTTQAVVYSVTTTGEDPEKIEAARARLMQRLSSPPRGGGPGDYVAWALQYQGCTRAWEYRNPLGPNTVSISYVRDGDGLGAAVLPDATDRAAMLAHMQARVPITVDVFVNELTAVPVPIVIGGLSPDTPEIRAGILLALQDQFARDSEPGMPMARSRIDAAISAAPGEFQHTLQLPASNPTPGVHEFLVLGDVSYDV